MIKRRLATVAILAAFFSAAQQGPAHAEVGRTEIEILEIQINGLADNVNERGLVWVRPTLGPWGSTNCFDKWVYFDPNAYPGVLAAALSAHATGRLVSIWVEDTPSLIIGTINYCRILKLRIH